MIKVKSESHGSSREQSFDADTFESSGGYVILKKDGSMVAMFAMGYWASVEKETAPQAEQSNAA